MLILKFLFLTLELTSFFKENNLIKICLRVIIINMKWLSIQVLAKPSTSKILDSYNPPKHEMA